MKVWNLAGKTFVREEFLAQQGLVKNRYIARYSCKI